jgi:hypothetical protein
MSAGDDLLMWASETGSGLWGQLRDTAAYLARVHDAGDRPWYLAAPLSDLGHLDLSWSSKRWSVSDPALVMARGCGLCVYLVGARPRRMLERFQEAADAQDVYPFDIRQGSAPAALFAKCASVESAQAVADRLRIPLLFDPSAALARRVPNIDPNTLELAAPVPLEETLEWFDPDSFEWLAAADRQTSGLYRTDLYGRSIFRLHRHDQWYQVDQAMGQLLVLSDRSDLLRWSRPSVDWATPSLLEVPSWLALPQLVDRALVAASGLLPTRQRGKCLYRNVSRVVAATLADRLGLRLSVVAESSAQVVQSSLRSGRG